jgi:hypothetical protein
MLYIDIDALNNQIPPSLPVHVCASKMTGSMPDDGASRGDKDFLIFCARA